MFSSLESWVWKTHMRWGGPEYTPLSESCVFVIVGSYTLRIWNSEFIPPERAQEYTLSRLKWALCISNHELNNYDAPTQRWNKNTNRVNESCVFRIMSLKNWYVSRMPLWGFNSLSSQFQRIIIHPVLGVVCFSTHTSHCRERLGMRSRIRLWGFDSVSSQF